MRKPLCLFLLLTLAACGGPKEPSGPPVVVYATESDPVNLRELFAAFTAETAIPVNVIWGGSGENTEAVIAKQGVPADVLITPNVSDIWRAADQGALRPIRGEAITSVLDVLRDPDSFWVALQRRFAVIAIPAHSAKQFSGDYEALVSKNYQGKLCLSSINNSINQAVIAMLIEDLGLKPAERVVRGWMLNMGLPPFETEEELVAALEAGDCQFGIVSNSANTIEMKQIGPRLLYVDVSAMGIGRHANNPERAQQLIDWLIVNEPLGGLAEGNGRNIGVIGWRHEEVMLLVERAGYR
jgi:iron(III) transport system substrate-binding protein